MNWKKYVVEQYLQCQATDEADYRQLKPAIKQKIYADFLSGDVSSILSAAKIVIHLDDLGFDRMELATIEKRCSMLPPSSISMFRDYRKDVQAGLMVIKNFTMGNACKCPVYQQWTQFLPAREVEMGFLRLTRAPFANREKYQEEQELTCLICGTEWQCIEINGYHYPWYEWIRK